MDAKRKKEELDAEIEKVKREYMEKQEEKARKRKEKKKKDKKEEKADKKAEEEEDQKDEKDRDEKVYTFVSYLYSKSNIIQIKSLEQKAPDTTDEGPRIFSLHKYIQLS